MVARFIVAVTVLSAAFLSGGTFAPPAQADSNCNDAASCLASLDDGNPGDNQGGDSGADRDRSRNRDKPQ